MYGLRLLANPRLQRLILITIAVILVGFRLLQFAIFTTQVQWGYDFAYYWRAAAAPSRNRLRQFISTMRCSPRAPRGRLPAPNAASATACPWSGIV